MQIAAAKPEYLDRASVPQERVEKEMEILKVQAMNEGKPADIAEKMVRKQMSNDSAQSELVNKLLDEIEKN